LNRDANAVRHEEGLALFIDPLWRKRFRDSLGNEKHRGVITNKLYHFSHRLDPRFAESVPTNQSSPESIGVLLRKRGAPSQCYVVSSNAELDGREMSLDEALAQTVGWDAGTFISCLPGKLAYFEDEDRRYLLHHPN
jgi:hypothetical protein